MSNPFIPCIRLLICKSSLGKGNWFPAGSNPTASGWTLIESYIHPLTFIHTHVTQIPVNLRDTICSRTWASLETASISKPWSTILVQPHALVLLEGKVYIQLCPLIKGGPLKNHHCLPSGHFDYGFKMGVMWVCEIRHAERTITVVEVLLMF